VKTAPPDPSGGPAVPAAIAEGRPQRRAILATAATAVVLIVIGVLGTFGSRGWGRVPFSIPSIPWYFSWPYYVFPLPGFDPHWGFAALLVAGAAAVAVLAAVRLRRPRPLWLAVSLALAFVLDLAVAAIRGGPSAWAEPISHPGEYAPAASLVGPIPTFLGHFAERAPVIGGFVAQHPPLAVIFYSLVARVCSGLTACAIATVACACLGLLVVAALARDELGNEADGREGRLAVAFWVLCPAVVLYSATSADAMWAPLLAGAALASHRGLLRRSVAWTLAGGALLWLASMATYAAVLVVPFLLVRAIALARSKTHQDRVEAEPGKPTNGQTGGWPWVTRWAALTAATVLGLVALLHATTGYDLLAVTRAVARYWSTAPGGGARNPVPWLFGAPVAFLAMLGFPLAAALLAAWWRALRQRAWGSFEVAFLASIIVGVAWGHSKGEVERMWGFLIPFAVVIATRQLTRWRANPTMVGALLLAQTIAVETLFYTRW
jgi:hypothetical protein